jgi:alpha-glucosidase
MVQIDWSPSLPSLPYIDHSAAQSDVEIDVTQEGSDYEISTADLNLRVRADGGLIFKDKKGETLRKELPPQFLGRGWIHRADLPAEASIYGLGERASRLNLRGHAYRMWNQDPHGNYGRGVDPLYVCIPCYLCLQSNGAYLLFYENSYDGTISFRKKATAQLNGGPLRYYFIEGSFQEIVRRYGQLTGFPPLPPRWALGYHQSRFSYETEAKVRQIADEFNQRGLPLSVLHLDIDYMDDYKVFTVHKGRFPDLAGLARELREQDVRLVTIVDPGIARDLDFDVYSDGVEQDVFLKLPGGRRLEAPVWPGLVSYPDFTDPKVRTWWGDQYQRLLEAGISGIWHDMNEPAAFAAWGDPSLPGPTRHSLEGLGADHRQAHNLYGLLMNRAGFEALRRERPDRRPFQLSRSGWAGLQQWAWNWTGDTESSWATLHQTIPTVLGLGLTGIPFSGSDIGGFAGSPSPELYLRWFQMAAFLPFFRTHSSNTSAPREPWSFGDHVLGYIRSALQLRYSLIPYFYTLAWQASRSGLPLVRPLFWMDGRDRDLWEIDDAFLLGESLLVAPVIEEGARQREVRLPAGRWYDFWEGNVLEGPSLVSLPAPLERCPLLIRAGTVLPLEEDDRLVLHAYAPAGDSVGGEVYSDAGDGYGDWRVDRFSLLREVDTLELTWDSEGDYPFTYSDIELRLHGFTAISAEIDGEQREITEDSLHVSQFRRITFKP